MQGLRKTLAESQQAKGPGWHQLVRPEGKRGGKSLYLMPGEQEGESEEVSGERQAAVRSHRALQALGRNWILS